jgi:Domain of unknown function (DUF4331)
MSSHREAPEIAKDPVADSTDLYAFVSPDRPDTVTIIANYVPLEGPAGGPNFYEFGDDVRYSILIDNDGDGRAEVAFNFEFTNEIRNPRTFLYNTGPIHSLDDPNWNRRQFYTVTRHLIEHAEHGDDDEHGERSRSAVLGTHLACPPNNIGPRSTPDYASLANAAIHDLPGGAKVFAGQRREGFYVDLGSIFDLGALRPVQNLHLIPMPAGPGVDATKDLNVHSIVLQVPKSWLTSNGSSPTDPNDTKSSIGVYTAAYRRKARVLEGAREVESGPWVQVSRLGNPLFNEVIVPMGAKDAWNATRPLQDIHFKQYVAHPELQALLPVLYPGVFPHLAAYTKERFDLEAILLTGIPKGVVAGFPGNFTGNPPADLLRLNMAIAPTAASKVSNLGLLGGDIGGFPNGRRVADDVVTIEIRAVAGLTIPLVDGSFVPDGAAAVVTQGVAADAVGDRYLAVFPYLGHPKDGFHTPAS